MFSRTCAVHRSIRLPGRVTLISLQKRRHRGGASKTSYYMTKTLLSFIAAFGLLQAHAADLPWLTDLEQAKSTAKTEKKAILLDFTGSDWCPPCIALHKNVFSTTEFAEFAKKKLVLVEVDFPRRKAQAESLKRSNRELQQKFEIEAFPTIVLLDSDGKNLYQKAGYGGTGPKEFIATLEKHLAK